MKTSGFLFLMMLGALLFLVRDDVYPIEPGKDGWPIFRGTSELTGNSGSSLPGNLKLLWRFETGDEIKSSPVIAENALYIGSDDGKLYKIGAENGALVWTFAAAGSIEAPALALDKIYFGDVTGVFYALDPESGRIKWKYKTGSQIIGSANYYLPPYANFPWILVGSYDTKIHCLNALSGMVIWTYQTKSYVNGTPAVKAREIVTGGCDAFLYWLDASSGAELGKIDTGSYIAGSPVLFGRFAYVANYSGRLVAIDLAARKIVWEFNEPDSQPFYSSPAVDNERLVLGSRNGYVYCFRRTDGRLLWSFATGDEINCSPLICSGQVVVGSNDGYLYLLSLKDGTKIWSYFIGAGISGSPAVARGTLFVAALDGAVYAFTGK